MNKTTVSSRIPYTVYCILVLAFLGFLDAAYLTILHYQNVIPPCTIAHGCETVLTSVYATIGPIPIALIGSLFYVALLFLGIQLLHAHKRAYILPLLWLTTGGVFVSVVLVGLQLFVIKALCQYCLASEAINVFLFTAAVILWQKQKKA